MPHLSTKVYGHELGISCAFRQWKANHSHCQYLHGYALSFKFVFGCLELDDKNWVADFGDLNALKHALQENFDHRTVVALDDPELEWFKEADRRGILKLLAIPAVGCEKFAEEAYGLAAGFIQHKFGDRVKVLSCEVSEHGANSAIFVGAVMNTQAQGIDAVISDTPGVA